MTPEEEEQLHYDPDEDSGPGCGLAVLIGLGLTLVLAALAFAVWTATHAHAHDIYTGVYGRGAAGTQQLCCGGSDCAATHYRERGEHYEFLTREGEWVAVPQERVTFLPVPGDDASGDPDPSHRAHLCYRQVSEYDRTHFPEDVFGHIFLFCAFIPPGGL